jgi:copper homeostasis protein
MVVKEVCVDNLNDAVRAYEAGANRIEYCSDLDQDGLTPNIDELLTLSKTIPIPIRCMLRPHSNSFTYNKNDIEKIRKTINFCKKNKIDGVVFGCLNAKNEIDFSTLKLISKITKPLKLIFHKAIDFTPDFDKSLRELIDSKMVDGVLTTGGKQKAMDNLELLSKISQFSPKKFEFIACGNITYKNYDYIHSIVKSKFYHGKKIIKF